MAVEKAWKTQGIIFLLLYGHPVTNAQDGSVSGVVIMT